MTRPFRKVDVPVSQTTELCVVLWFIRDQAGFTSQSLSKYRLRAQLPATGEQNTCVWSESPTSWK